jgi:hypothetical protein
MSFWAAGSGGHAESLKMNRFLASELAGCGKTLERSLFSELLDAGAS